jgi:hypothetical protein
LGLSQGKLGERFHVNQTTIYYDLYHSQFVESVGVEAAAS